MNRSFIPLDESRFSNLSIPGIIPPDSFAAVLEEKERERARKEYEEEQATRDAVEVLVVLFVAAIQTKVAQALLNGKNEIEISILELVTESDFGSPRPGPLMRQHTHLFPITTINRGFALLPQFIGRDGRILWDTMKWEKWDQDEHSIIYSSLKAFGEKAEKDGWIVKYSEVTVHKSPPNLLIKLERKRSEL